jgi:hypothetical protein
MPEIKGSCRCGKVTYTSAADVVFTGICHCGHCQKSTGSAFGTVVAVPTASLTITGITRRFTDAATAAVRRIAISAPNVDRQSHNRPMPWPN